jgi:hypothetical protein
MNNTNELGPLTVAELENILFAQGCSFGLPERHPDTGERLSMARRELRDRVGVCFYPGSQNDSVSSDLLLRVCIELGQGLSVHWGSSYQV